jgi:hypothetical protein
VSVCRKLGKTDEWRDAKLVLDRNGMKIDNDKLLDDEISKGNTLMILFRGQKWMPGETTGNTNEFSNVHVTTG